MTNISVPMNTPDWDMPERCDLLADCTCIGVFDDPQARAVAALVAAGIGQREASLQVYTERGRLSAAIHDRTHKRFPWLRGCCEVTS